MIVNVIGLGQIGENTIGAMKKAKVKDVIHGTDINPQVVKRFVKNGFNASKDILLDADVYIISVLTTDQVISVVDNIVNMRDDFDNYIIVIESTIAPFTHDRILMAHPKLNLVIFPHRFFSDDPKYHVFNLNRVMGASSKKALTKAMTFYGRYMSKKRIHITSISTAELCKPLENSIRHIEIATAEQVRIMCESKGYNFNEVRAAINTKWNINLLEARDGIKRHCLPKDIKLINDNFDIDNLLFTSAEKIDKRYKELELWKKKNSRKTQ